LHTSFGVLNSLHFVYVHSALRHRSSVNL
jgi:hypothetical protein